MTLFTIRHTGSTTAFTTFGDLMHRFGEILAELRTRRTIQRDMRALSDIELRDIGLIRHELGATCAAALDQPAAAALAASARKRSGNW